MKNNHDKILLEFQLPGFNRDDIKIKFHKGWVHILASKKTEIKEQRKGFFHDETTSKVFEYRAALPNEAYPTNAKIDFQGEVLRIMIPKLLPRGQKQSLDNFLYSPSPEPF